ncbi:MAG: alkaline phosphatase family protein, partial [Chloroflexota bacterium]|nr:alkaline phosphatase family protein [Chloroflexota bacterium]
MTHFVRPAYGQGCFADLPALIQSCLTDQAFPTGLSGLDSALLRHYDAVIVVLADGFGWRFFERFAERDPFLQRFAGAGTVACWTSQFPSTTAAHVTTLHSGLPVGQHGVFEWQYYEPTLDALIAPLLFSFAGTKQRETLQTAGITPDQLYPPRTLYQTLAQAGVTSSVYQHRDYTPSTYSDWMYRGATVKPYITLPEALLNLRLQLTETPAPAYCFLYFDKIDTISHEYGPDSPQVDAEIETFLFCMERALMQPLLKTAKNTLLILTADHGQTEVNPRTTLYLN